MPGRLVRAAVLFLPLLAACGPGGTADPRIAADRAAAAAAPSAGSVAPALPPATAATPPPDADAPASDADPVAPAPAWVAAARRQIGVTLHYDPAYARLDYPGGDVPVERGVCTDVVIRALRPSGLDLQQAVHEDMRGNFPAYPRAWGLSGPDRNIDHRRVPNLERWFERQGWARPLTTDAAAFAPGDIVTWRLPQGLPHIGIVSDRRRQGRPLVIHNVGAGTREEDVLFAYTLQGHYRPPRDLRAATRD